MSNGLIAPNVVPSAPIESPTQNQVNHGAPPTVHRSASHMQLALEASHKAAPARTNSIHRSFSENVLSNTPGNVTRENSTRQESDATVKKGQSLKRLGSSTRRPPQQEAEPHFTVSKFIVGTDQPLEDVAYEPANNRGGRTPDRELRTRSVSGSLSNFARKSWASASRSPSPSPSKNSIRKDIKVAAESEASYSRSTDKVSDATHDIAKAPMNGGVRRNSILSKRPRRPISSLLSKGTGVPDTPLVPPIPKSFSTDRLPSLKAKSSTLGDYPALPKSKSSERLSGYGQETQRKKDELWSVFRNLDGEYQKFQSKPGTLKTAVVRSTLLPFLRLYAEHPSISSLRPEDMDRRTVILNKWWTGLLEMLNGRHGESVSGNDRPAILEAVTALMVRPEWTIPSTAIAARPSRASRASLKSRSTTSLVSTMTMSSDFIAESVYHNTKNIFTQNLLAQMAYVVDKLSMRTVAASVVAFCGKATAYAFFYCEGVAEILVRLWATPTNTLRRVFAENGVHNDAKFETTSDKTRTLFPPCLHSLAFRSVSATVRHLRKRPHVPIATAYIPWHGPWVGRWAGQDTDLFYVFTKFYTDLVCRFLPEDPSVEEKLAAPGWLLVQAQILSVIDATMQRVNNQPSIDQRSPSSVTFDEMLGEADASATVLPLPANGAIRSMAENRLILLLRDCLSGSTIMTTTAQSIFAQTFSTLLKAAARKISVFDHNACFALCDFLEEALAILTRFYHASKVAMATIDWAFWLEVCKHMLQSHNSMTEVRLCAFLYAMWPTITANPDSKSEVCLGWILQEEIFWTQFNHWCPMVRAFFMRLLAWRIARVDGRNPDLDRSILKALNDRLQETWRHFLYLQNCVGIPPVAAPSTPAPGRRLLIMRNDVQPAPAGMLLSFDGILSSSATLKADPYERRSSTDPLSQGDINRLAKRADGRSSSSDVGKKRWSLFKSILPVSSVAKGPPKPDQPSYQKELAQDTKMDARAAIEKRMGPTPAYRSLSFKFSLEWFDRDSNLGGNDRELRPPQLPFLAQMAFTPHQANALPDNPTKPEGVAAENSKYAGRALAEWALLVTECKNFFERRMAEGVPTYQMVETPTLGVEPFRKL